ncbi:hypothetical protein ACMU_18110 [Actibacterium mucosum KCTC 23349]|uniref:Uncharacterized protein n=1 Tax=Actibacterium mucosum KCTC 23349 TaxID=1454373 RepID=A0A037ZCX7_9RHOB|nr:hypothetical protein [Actibacterium mucosum]KAJ54344.1 hypothetical protein ACMU_18110 [Actibacterium mucosum KCTC 23349]
MTITAMIAITALLPKPLNGVYTSTALSDRGTDALQPNGAKIPMALTSTRTISVANRPTVRARTNGKITISVVRPNDSVTAAFLSVWVDQARLAP